MPASGATGYAYNRTRKSYLARDLMVANTHWLRLRGLMGADPSHFPAGKGLWIVPCRGVHTVAMRFPIDVVYLDKNKVVVGLEENLRPWRVAPLRLRAATVLELPSETVGRSRTCVGDKIDIGFDGNEVRG